MERTAFNHEPKVMKLKRIETGIYKTLDGKFRVIHWEYTAWNRKSWAVCEWDGEGWDFVCEVFALREGRGYLNGENVFILS